MFRYAFLVMTSAVADAPKAAALFFDALFSDAAFFGAAFSDAPAAALFDGARS
ncbi:hypothetical protein ACFZCY_16940 [Streptomyces sp. NPDC007983]|uniref:hypothetical protein n=1 Tax=Streptomyces sp. NPDC007983 TaxID=3364800 RepID=UPI0036EC97D1